jgi:hypothetical protein
MPAPLKEYACSVHGAFDSRAKAPRCPYGCSTIYWSPRTPPSIRTNSVTATMDALQYRVAAEQGLSDMSSRYIGESVADHRQRPPTPDSFDNPRDYMAAIAQGRAPATSVWGNPSQVGLRAPSQEERAQITPTVGTWDGNPPPKVPTIVANRPDPNERAVVADLARSET